MTWSGSICLSGNDQVKDISIDHVSITIPKTAQLRFLTLVEVQRIPLYLMLNAPLKISTSNVETERWFRDILLSSPNLTHHEVKWWEAARPDSPIGILVAVEDPSLLSDSSHPRITELLFHASQGANYHSMPSSVTGQETRGEEVASSPELEVYATAISSDLLYTGKHGELTPPASPLVDVPEADAVFLPDCHSTKVEIINEPPTRKRRSATEAFDEANERRKRARRKGGEGVAAAAAAASKMESNVVPLNHRRSTSNSQAVPLQTRPLSRSPSVASSRPATAVTSGAKRSALSRVETATSLPDGQSQSVEAKNKDTISRIVMAGMRLYGLSQSNSRKTRTSTASIDGDDEVDRGKDEEYKLVYHQTFKGTCFAFRATIGAQSLQPLSDAVRDVADKLLSIFCGNPLAEGSESTALDGLTPGGRKAFGSSASKKATQFNETAHDDHNPGSLSRPKG